MNEEKKPEAAEENKASDFIREIIKEELAAGKHSAGIVTRFPPEPNGYLHIGHAKSIVLNFGLAQEYGGTTNLRFDDTDPAKEDVEYVDSIKEDVRWLGYEWDGLYFASDYFEQLYEWAIQLIKEGKAYVDDQSMEEIRENRGNFYRPGVDSPYRDRSVEENLALFEAMKAGEFPDGAKVLRAKIDMAHTNLNMRDPLMYRIKRATHHRTGDDWCIYPMYDWAHGQSDAIEGITHSVCTLEFEDHRPLYDWFVEAVKPATRPRQIEFARLNLNYTVMSKRRLLKLVQEGHVSGWDDPRMPTLAGMRRRGYPARAIRTFAERVGVAKRDGVIDVSMLEHAVREELNQSAPRIMAVVKPLKVVIENLPEGEVIELESPFFPEDYEGEKRVLPFTRELYIEQDDFREEAPRKWFRLSPGKEVRLRYACLITCQEVIKNEAGEVVELRCTWDPESKGGKSPDGRKVKGTLHWLSAAHAVPIEVRSYDRLFKDENPMAPESGESFLDALNPNSLETTQAALIEPSQASLAVGSQVQFERLGYYCVDPDSAESDHLIFNKTIGLRDSWAKIEKKAKGTGTKRKRKRKRNRGKDNAAE